MCFLFQYDDEHDKVKLTEQEHQQRQNHVSQPAMIMGTASDKDETISGMLADFSRSIGNYRFYNYCVIYYLFSL